MCFFSRTMYVQIQLLQCNVPFMMYNNWPERTPDLLPVEHVWDMMKQELTLSPEPATTIAKLRQWVQDAWDNLSQDDIQHLYDRLHVRIHACIAARGGTLCIDVTVCASLAVTCASFGLNLSHTQTTCHISFQYNELGLEVVAFFFLSSVYDKYWDKNLCLSWDLNFRSLV